MPDDEILDAIKDGRFAAVKRELASKLKRFPNKSYYWALHCYFLYATGDLDLAQKECNTLKQKVPSDPEALDILADVYVKLGLTAESHDVWTNAIKKYPTTDLILRWFGKTVLSFDGRNMQKAAMLLQKHAKSKRDYGVWAALCNYLWSKECTEEKEQTLHTSLALGLIEKAHPLQNNGEIFVYVSILALKQDYAKIADTIAPLEYRELELTLIYLDALDKLGKWEQLALECKTLLFEKEFDDFDTWKYLIKASSHLKVPYADLESLITFSSRNLYMAYVELSNVYGSNLSQAIDKYYQVYFSKPCCPIDLSNYELSGDFYHSIDLKCDEILALGDLDSKQATTLTNIEKLRIAKDPTHLVDWSSYLKYNSAELSELYLIHMVQSLKNSWSPEALLEHIVHLEFYSKNDPENFKVKLWLLNLYGAIGASNLALKVYKELKIKMIQHDLYLYKLRLAPSIGNLNELVLIYRFYLTSDHEVGSYVDGVFEKGLYSKAEDLLRFGKRLFTSLSRHMVVLEILKVSRMIHNDYYNYFYRMLKETKEYILGKDFTVNDNREFSTEYKFGLELPHLPFQDADRVKGKEYVQLHYIKELLIAEKNDSEIKKLVKLLNKWMSNNAYTNQLSPFENQMFKLYSSLFKVAKCRDASDRDLQLNYLKKNIDFGKLKLAYISKLSPLSAEASQILIDLWELAGSIRAMLTHAPLVSIADKLEKDLTNYNATSEQIECLNGLKAKLEFPSHLATLVEDQWEDLAAGIKNSSYRSRLH